MFEFWSPSTLVLFGSLIAIFGAFLASRQQASFEHELRQKTERTLGEVSGGDSWCYVIVAGGTDFVLAHKGQFPMFDVEITIRGEADRPTPEQLQRMTMQELLKTGQHFSRDIVYEGMGSLLGPVNPSPSDADQQRFNILIRARNGVIDQQLYIGPLRPSRLPKQAWKVRRADTVLMEQPDPIPMLEDGTPDWSKID